MGRRPNGGQVFLLPVAVVHYYCNRDALVIDLLRIGIAAETVEKLGPLGSKEECKESRSVLFRGLFCHWLGMGVGKERDSLGAPCECTPTLSVPSRPSYTLIPLPPPPPPTQSSTTPFSSQQSWTASCSRRHHTCFHIFVKIPTKKPAASHPAPPPPPSRQLHILDTCTVVAMVVDSVEGKRGERVADMQNIAADFPTE